MSKENNEKRHVLDSDNQLADKLNEKLKLDEKGNIALLLVCIGNFFLLLFFQYLIEVIILKQKDFNLIWAIVFSLIVTSVTSYYSYKIRNKNTDKN